MCIVHAVLNGNSSAFRLHLSTRGAHLNKYNCLDFPAEKILSAACNYDVKQGAFRIMVRKTCDGDVIAM